MTRINVYRYDEYDGKTTLDGWFEWNSAEKFEADTRWNGHDHVDINTADQFSHQILLRTTGGRWVLHQWSQRQGSEVINQFVTDTDARQWLIENGHDQVVARYFGEIEEERGPGRPEVGAVISTRIGDDLLAAVDAEAKTSGISRAETIRRLIGEALNTRSAITAELDES